MAESKFLKYQDPSGAGLAEECDVFIEVAEVPCEEGKCFENSTAITPNWRKLDNKDVFLNEKKCLYQVVIETKYTTTLEDGADALDTRYEQYAGAAITTLLEANNKDTGAAAIRTIEKVLEYTDWYLDERPKSRLRLLYSVPYSDIYLIEEAEDEEDSSLSESGDTEATYTIQDLKSKLIAVRKGLHLYGRYLKVYRILDGGNLFYQNGAAAGTPFPLEEYGDWGVLGGSFLGRLLPQLDKFLNSKGYNIRGVGGLKGMFGDTVEKVTFTFSAEYTLKKLMIYTTECGEKPILFIKKLTGLTGNTNYDAWSDPTSMAYLARLDDMVRDLSAREPIPWLEFVKTHTYPTIYSSINQGYANTDPENSIGSCVAAALKNEAKQLGQDILDPAFGIGDAIAYQFNKHLCRDDPKDVIKDEMQAGLVWGLNSVGERGTDIDPETNEVTERKVLKELRDMAAVQAGETVGLTDATFEEFCNKVKTDAIGDLGALWEEGFDKIKLCGLYNMLISSVKCLFSGLTLEESLSTIAESALRAMSLENFGSLLPGLPPEKQAEIDALVKSKFESGDFFSGAPSSEGNLEYTKPWEDEELVQDQQENQMKSGITGETTVPAGPITEPTDPTRRTLVQQLDFGSAAKKQLSPNNVFEAYILALIEVYSENYFELLEELNKFPGAQLIATIIATMDCPRGPVADPSFFDIIKDVQLPFCQNANEIQFPPLGNPFGWIPEVKDITKILWLAVQTAIQEAIVAIMLKLMLKVCQTIGSAACAVAQVAATRAAALLNNKSNFSDLIKESICGDDADAEQIDNTIVDMFADLGAGAAALADTEQVISFTEDVSAAVTKAELANAFLGDCSDEFLTIVNTLLVYEYPDFLAALPNKQRICNFFGNMGNLMPSDFRDDLREMGNDFPDAPLAPANPSLCATDEQIEDFCALRSELLSGRATEEQIAKLCERDGPLEDLKDLADVLQGGLPTDELPPLISDPGCDNGILPFESDEAKAVATASLNGVLEQLKVAFAKDMLGTGPGEANWGFINMILSDTMGNPLTAHMRKASNMRKYVNFYMEEDDPDDSVAGGLKALVAQIFPDPPKLQRQRGSFPYKVAAWLEDYMQDTLTVDFAANNEYQAATTSDPASFKDAGVSTFGGGLNLLKSPVLQSGYNIEPKPDMEEEEISYTIKARKGTPDFSLSFQNNGRGFWAEGSENIYDTAFKLEFYLSDLISGPRPSITYVTGEESRNRFDDNVRIKITNTNNSAFDPDKDKNNDEIVTVEESKFEFIAADSILEEVDLDSYTKFLSTFKDHQDYLPQIVLLDEMIGAGTIEKSDIESSYNSIMNVIIEKFIELIATNENAFLYGAQYDDLSFDDVEYVIAEPLSEEDGYMEDYPAGTNYYTVLVNVPASIEVGDVTIPNPLLYPFPLGKRPLLNTDQIMGVSRMQYEIDAGTYSDEDAENRVIYLDPGTFGGSYMNPPLYIKPFENKGWLGFMDVMFPDLSPCKPYKTDLIDFEDIQQKLSTSYPTIPEDERLKSDPDCVIETPYARILERSAVAGIESIITAAIRIYTSASFIKSMATFTKFYPKFPDVFSSIYAAYIIEEMEASFKDAQKPGWEMFNPFKDSEFWYAFLEQSVQLYSRRVDNGEISEPPASVIEALVRLNDAQESYDYPDKKMLEKAREDGEAGTLETLRGYRTDKNLEAIQETEEDAKMVMKELVIEQLNYMGEKFVENLETVGMSPDIYDMSYYVLQDLSQGGSGLDLHQEIEQEYEDLPEYDASNPLNNEEHYTNGGEFALPAGTEYVGYYHVGVEEGATVYVTGEFSGKSVEGGETLTPFANKVIVPIGDIAGWDSVDVDTSDISKPFVIEKYISIDGSKYSPTDAIDYLSSTHSNLGQNISDVYPGDLELVTNSNGRVVGLKGELGIRHGLIFSVIIDGNEHTVTTVEVDALDRPLSQLDPLEENSLLLLCLINKLKEDDKFRLVAEYIFPLNKIVATLAIYNGLAFMPSIGEKVANTGESWGNETDLTTKPGVSVSFDDTTGVAEVESSGEEGAWASAEDRKPGFFAGLFVNEWDNWDKTLLRNSTGRIKKIFKSYYNSRDFTPGRRDDSDSPGTAMTNEFKSRFKIKPGQQLLPWWKKRMLRSSPFNADGELCEKKD